MGNFLRDFPCGSVPMCFHCNQVGHKKADGTMLRVGAVSAPAPVTLRISDGRGGRERAPTVRSRVL